MEILNKLVYAETTNQAAKDLLADAFEPIGYQKERSSVRNSFLAAAHELRSGIPGGIPPNSSGPDTVRAMSTGLWLDFLGIRLDSTKAEGIKLTINLITPDNGEKFVVEMSNSTLTNIQGVRTKYPDLTIALTRSDLEMVMMGKATFDDLIAHSKAKFDGNRKPFDQLTDILSQFTPDFEMMPGTKPAKAATPAATGSFEQADLTRSDGG